VSEDAKYDVIYCLFSAKIDDIYAQLCSAWLENGFEKTGFLGF